MPCCPGAPPHPALWTACQWPRAPTVALEARELLLAVPVLLRKAICLKRPTTPILPRPCPCCGGRMSSSIPSRRGSAPSTDPRLRQPRSGSTPLMMLSAPSAPHRTRILSGSPPQYQTAWRRSARLARDRTAILSSTAIPFFSQPAKHRFKLPAKRSIASVGLNFPTTPESDQTSPYHPLHCRCLTPRDFVPVRFSDSGCPSWADGIPASANLQTSDLTNVVHSLRNGATIPWIGARAIIIPVARPRL